MLRSPSKMLTCANRWHWISLIDFRHKIELIYLFCFVIVFGERTYPSNNFAGKHSGCRTAAASAKLHQHLSTVSIALFTFSTFTSHLTCCRFRFRFQLCSRRLNWRCGVGVEHPSMTSLKSWCFILNCQ